MRKHRRQDRLPQTETQRSDMPLKWKQDLLRGTTLSVSNRLPLLSNGPLNASCLKTKGIQVKADAGGRECSIPHSNSIVRVRRPCSPTTRPPALLWPPLPAARGKRARGLIFLNGSGMGGASVTYFHLPPFEKNLTT